MKTTNFNYATINPSIRVRLYNANKEMEDTVVKVDATEYGFEGLVLVPVIDLGEVEEGKYATVKVTEDMCKEWKKTPEEVATKGIDNMDYTIKSMREVLISSMFPEGIPADDPFIDMMLPPDDGNMWVVSNKSLFYGAAAVIKAFDELKAKFPNGWTVLPSSLHEVIVLPKGITDGEDMNDIVRQVNTNVLNEADYLSDDVYEFVA